MRAVYRSEKWQQVFRRSLRKISGSRKHVMHSWFIECGCESIKGSQSGVRVAAFANLLRSTNPCHEPLSATHAQSAEGPRGAGLAETTTPNRERLGVGVWWTKTHQEGDEREDSRRRSLPTDPRSAKGYPNIASKRSLGWKREHSIHRRLIGLRWSPTGQEGCRSRSPQATIPRCVSRRLTNFETGSTG